MFKKRFSKFRPKRYRKKAPVRKAVARARSSVFKKKVLSVIKAQTETKQAFHSITSQAIRNQISTSSDMNVVIPAITQGTGDNNRIGDQVTLQRLSVKGYLRLPVDNTANSAYNRRIALRMMLVKPKRYNSKDDIVNNATTWMPSLLKKGGTTVGFTGAINDLWAPINSDAITKYYDKVIYLKQDALVTSGGAAATQVIPVSYSAEGTLRFFSITKKFNKILKYDANIDSGTYPINNNMVLVIGLVYLNGDAPTGTTQAYLSFDTVMDFEDA